MAKVLIVVRIMPADSEIDVDELAKKLSSSLVQGIEIASVSKEAMAFGMHSLLVSFLVPEEEGATERLEGYLGSFSEIGEISIEGMTRTRG